MTLSGAKARFELNATATPTGTYVINDVVVGKGLTTNNFASATLALSFLVKDNASGGGTFTFHPGNCTVTQTIGTGGTITDGDGKDFEGVSLGAITNFNGLMVECSSNNSGTVGVAATSRGPVSFNLVAQELFLWVCPAGSNDESVTITTNDPWDQATVTIIGN